MKNIAIAFALIFGCLPAATTAYGKERCIFIKASSSEVYSAVASDFRNRGWAISPPGPSGCKPTVFATAMTMRFTREVIYGNPNREAGFIATLATFEPAIKRNGVSVTARRSEDDAVAAVVKNVVNKLD